MENYVLPGILAAIIFIMAMISAVGEYTVSGSVTAGTVALLFSALAIGVMAQRFYVLQKELLKLKEKITDKFEAETVEENTDSEQSEDDTE
jgi:hypothetical protein